MQKGVGSVWNQGSWHWEEKNYNKFAHESLKALFSTISLTAGGYEIAIVKCISIEGEAAINIRKQKQIYLFNITANLGWRAENLAEDSDEAAAKGEILLREFNQDDYMDLDVRKIGVYLDGER